MAYNNMNNESQGYPQAPHGYPQSPPGYAQPYPPPNAADYGWKPNTAAEQPQPGQSSSGTAFIDPEDLQPKNMAFTDESIRRGFIRKVYLILMGQLTFTFGIVALFVFHRPTQEFSERNPGLLMAACILTLVLVIAMACCETARRQFPTNFICLSLFTVAESFLVGAIASRYEPQGVLMAVGITALLCLSLTLFAMQTKIDFTACGGILLACLIIMLLWGIVGIWFHSHIMKTIYASLGALLACVFLVYDTQLMMGGNHKYSISPEEYIFAALNLYMDVIRIFLYILQLIGNKK